MTQNLSILFTVISRNKDDSKPHHFRGQVMDFRKTEKGGIEVEVFFVDEGKTEWKKPKLLRTIPARFLEHPKTAIQCTLHGIS